MPSYEFDRFRLDPSNHLLLADGKSVPLTPKAFDVLVVLVQNGGRLTTKEDLMKKVWPDSFVEEANLTVNISALRKALTEVSDGQYIETVPTKGYRFAVAVREIIDAGDVENSKERGPFNAEIAGQKARNAQSEQAEFIVETTRFNLAQQPHAKIAARRWFAAIGSLLVVLAFGAYFYFTGRTSLKPPVQSISTLAVLPFQNLQGNSDSDFLGFSLADAVITKLGYVSELSVRPSYAVQKYKNQQMDIRRVARELHVDALLTGTFVREGDDLRIACQLIDAKAESIFWKGSFDLKYDKLLTVQDRVAEQIIKGLELTVSPSEAGRLKADPPISPLAYEYYLRGVDLYAASEIPMAIKMLEKSTELAPDYALAWANLGRAYTANASFQMAGAEQYQKAQTAFERALALQSDQIDARVYMANMFTDTGRVEKAVPLLRDALRTSPNNAEIHWELGYAYRYAGMLQDSVLESESARRLDPNVKLNSSTPNAYLYLGQYDKFIDSLPLSDDQPLLVFYRGFAEYYKKDWDAAAKNFDRAYSLDRNLFQAQIGKAFGFGIQGEAAQGLSILRTVEARITQRAVGDPEAIYKLAQAYAVLGDSSSALRVLRRSIDRGFFPFPYFETDPLLASLRGNPEFRRVLETAHERHLVFRKRFF